MKILSQLKKSRRAKRRVQQEFRIPVIKAQEPRARYLSVACIARNEAKNLREWLEFHRLVGVEHFTFYDNCSQDNTREILAPYVARGLVEIIPWPHFAPDYDTQALAYAHALSHAGPKTRWLAFFDLDEFLFPTQANTLPEILTEYEHLPGLVVYWLVFGTSGIKEPVDGLISEHFTMRALVPAEPVKDMVIANYKSIVQPDRVIGNRGAHNFIIGRDGCNGYDERCRKIFRKMPRAVTVDTLRINHYFTKSVAEWNTRYNRTGGTGAVSRNDFLDQAFAKVEQAPVEDRVIQRYLPALKQALRQ